MEIELEPIRARRLSQLVVDRLTALIEEGQLDIGDRLPSERNLMQQLGVGRASLREALRILESQGLIQVQPGKGAFVKNTVSHSSILPGLVSWFEEHRAEISDVMEVRELLESHAAWRAAQHISPASIAKLRQSIDSMELSIQEGTVVEVTDADRTFHRSLYEASDNQFLNLVGDGIVAALFGPRYSILRVPGRAARSVEEHRAILKAIEAGNSLLAAEMVHKHLASVKEALSSLPLHSVPTEVDKGDSQPGQFKAGRVLPPRLKAGGSEG